MTGQTTISVPRAGVMLDLEALSSRAYRMAQHLDDLIAQEASGKRISWREFQGVINDLRQLVALMNAADKKFSRLAGWNFGRARA